MRKYYSKDPLWKYTDPFPFDSIYNSYVSICNESIYSLMIIPSRFGNPDERKFFRERFPQFMKINNKTIGHLFVIAINDSDYNQWHNIILESRHYGDIIITRTPEGNIHLSKIMWNTHLWISNHCMSTNYITKLDTDSVIHIHNLVSILEKLPHKGVYTGYVWKKGKTRETIKSIDDRWVFPSDYIHYKESIPFVSGIAEIFSIDIIPYIAVGHNYQPIFMTAGEDIMTAIVLDRINIHAMELITNCKLIPSTRYRKISKEFAVIHSPDFKNLTHIKMAYSNLIKNNSECSVILNRI